MSAVSTNGKPGPACRHARNFKGRPRPGSRCQFPAYANGSRNSSNDRGESPHLERPLLEPLKAYTSEIQALWDEPERLKISFVWSRSSLQLA